MTKNPLRSSAGFTYIAALVMVVITGIMLSVGAQSWTMMMQREREAELLYRGTQVRDALRRWYKIKPPAVAAPGAVAVATQVQLQGPSPAELKDLLNGTTSAAKVHFLRPSNLKVRDPATGKELDWELFKDPTIGKVTGVFIKSEGAPIKQANFPLDLDPADFEAKKKYSDWVFICNHFPKPSTTGTKQQGLPETPVNAPH